MLYNCTHIATVGIKGLRAKVTLRLLYIDWSVQLDVESLMVIDGWWRPVQVFCGHQDLPDDDDDDDRREYGVNLLRESEDRTSSEPVDSQCTNGSLSPPWVVDHNRFIADVNT